MPGSGIEFVSHFIQIFPTMTIRNCLAAALIAVGLNVAAQPPVISFQNQNITGLTQPVDLVNAGDGSGRMFIVQRNGMVKIWNGGTTTTDFLNMGSTGENLITTGGSEEGLLSIAFHPDYDGVSNRYFFTYYTDVSGNIALRRYETVLGNPDLADVTSDQLILTIPHPTNSNHNGGKLNFGSDGYLYFGTGDGGGGGDIPNNAQTGNVLLGKMLRIDIDNPSVPYGLYSVPSDNPYLLDAGIDDKIYALGLRNPFRWSFDRANGNIWIGDVGQGAREEINFRSATDAAAGTNYGWRCYEGTLPYNTTGCLPQSSYTSPVFDYPNAGSGAAVTGGYVYRGSEYPNFYGYYIAADVYSGNLYLIWPNGNGGWSSASQPGIGSIVGFGESEDGTLYAVSIAGAIHKVVATGGTALPVRFSNWSAQRFAGYNELKWTTSFEENTAKFHVQFSTDAVNYDVAGIVNASGNSNGSGYLFKHQHSASTVYYRLMAEDHDGVRSYSSVLKISSNPGDRIRVYPTVLADRNLNISAPVPVRKIQVIGSNGAVVYEKTMNNFIGSAILQLPSLTQGIYIVHLISDSGGMREKIVIR